MLKIGVDAMGGDFAPKSVVLGAIKALSDIDDTSKIVLFGDKEQIEQILKQENVDESTFDIVHTSQVIGMNDHPAHAFVKKTDSSITVGFKHLMSGQIDGFASAGNTGAIMAGSMQIAKEIPGIIRPAISALVSALNGKETVLLDVGLNVDCKPDVLYQYGIIGSAYATNVLKVENPKVALLNIGEEREKGNIASKAAYELMEQGKHFNFVGNIESKHIFSGEHADVVVCDGFVGNIILKMAEGFYELARGQGVNNKYINRLNYESVGGTAVLGINANVMVGHGCSTPLAIRNMILQTEQNIKGELVEKLREIFN